MITTRLQRGPTISDKIEAEAWRLVRQMLIDVEDGVTNHSWIYPNEEIARQVFARARAICDSLKIKSERR